jgi:hypothetical protein
VRTSGRVQEGRRGRREEGGGRREEEGGGREEAGRTRGAVSTRPVI